MPISLPRTGRRCVLALAAAALLASGCTPEDPARSLDASGGGARAGSTGSGAGTGDHPDGSAVTSPVPEEAPTPAELPPVAEAPEAPAVAETQPPVQPPGATSSGGTPGAPGAVGSPSGQDLAGGRGAPPAPAAAAVSSGGAGGTFTDQPRSRFTAGNGLSGQYLRYAAGVDPARPVGLLVYVDGTGEYGVDNPTSPYALGGPAGLVATGRARNMITLAVESPDQACECWHTGNTAGYADFLAELIEDHIGSYPVGEVWLAGYSSGAQEITRFLVPRHPELLRLGGGWVVFGGGGPPEGRTGLTAGQLAGVRGHWFTGTADTSVPLTAAWGGQAGERWYAAHGVRTSAEWPAGVGHSLDGRFGGVVARVIDAG